MADQGVLGAKVAIVTGSGRGLGRGIALALAAEGASVVVCGRTPDTLDETVGIITGRGGTASAIRIDVTNPAECARLVEHAVDTYGTIDILVNNAQSDHGADTLVLDIDEATFEAGFRSGPLATLRMMQLSYPYLRGGGVVVNLASGAGLRSDPVGYGAYGAVKEAIRTLSRAAAVEWGPENIRVHVVCPLSGLDAWVEAFPEEAAAYLSTVPLGRVGDAERDIGRAVVFLCGPDSSYMTGTTIMLDGGRERLR